MRDRCGCKCWERPFGGWGQYASATTSSSLEGQTLPQYLMTWVLCKWGGGEWESKQVLSSSFVPLFDLSPYLSPAGVSQHRQWQSLSHLGYTKCVRCATWCVRCATATTIFLWAPAHCSSVSDGSKYPWEAHGRGKCSNTTKGWCCLHMVGFLEPKHTASTKDVLSSPVPMDTAPSPQFRDSFKLSLYHILSPAALLFPSFLPCSVA